jgi:glycosyltransferase involved in cell wall biosynthesis
MKNSSNPIRVLHVVGGVMDVGGIEMFLMNYYRHIDRTKIQFDFCITEKGISHFDEEIRVLGGIVYNLPSKIKNPISHLRTLNKVLRKYRHLPIHLHLDGMNGIYGLIALIYKNKIRISHSHSTNHLTIKKIKRLFHDFSRILNRHVNNYYAACSKDAAIWLHGKYKATNYVHIRNSIDIKKFEFNNVIREGLRLKYNIKNKVVIGHVGRFSVEKNHYLMVKIATELKKINIDFKFVFVGSGELFDGIRKMVQMNHLTDEIIFTGKTALPEQYYHMMDIYIQPSKFEGFGISVVEAQYNGLPVIISDFIPKEVVLCDNVSIIKSMEPFEWVNIIKQTKLERTGITNMEYSIKVSSTILEDFYLNTVNMNYKNEKN